MIRVLACIIALLAAAPAWAGKRVALVVGNSAYENIAPLDNPRNDARLLATTLAGLGFTLVGGAAQLDLFYGGSVTDPDRMAKVQVASDIK
jgi:hypothetical protein